MRGDVLITSATGLVGGEAAIRLIRAGWRAWCVVRSGSYAEAAARLERRFGESRTECDWSRLVALPGNITEPLLGLDPRALGYLRDRCRRVIHCAAETSFAPGNRCLAVNLAGTENVLRLCAALGRETRLFYTSSAVVCLRPERSVVSEQAPYGGFSNEYVLSKRRCEDLVRESGVNAVVLRPSIVLSHGLRSPEHARAVLWVLPVIRALGALPMTGDERVDVVSVGYVAEAMARIIDRPLTHRVLHLSAGVESSVTWKVIFETLTGAGYAAAPHRHAPIIPAHRFLPSPGFLRP